MKWITRARPKTDRIACPWLITKFIDPAAEILYVPAGQVLDTARRQDADSFDAPGARDRKSTRLNSSHLGISYAVFCLKKKKNNGPHLRSTDAIDVEIGGGC